MGDTEFFGFTGAATMSSILCINDLTVGNPPWIAAISGGACVLSSLFAFRSLAHSVTQPIIPKQPKSTINALLQEDITP